MSEHESELRDMARRILEIARHNHKLAQDNVEDLQSVLRNEMYRLNTLDKIIEDLQKFGL